MIVSYNGYLDIKEEDFETIMRDLTVLSDHKVILFPNMSSMHQRSETALEDISEDEWSVSRVRLVDEFMIKYMSYAYDRVDEERVFNNLSYFVKCSAGGLSLKKKHPSAPLDKYGLSNRMHYLDTISQATSFNQQQELRLRPVQL